MTKSRAIAIVGMGSILPDAFNIQAFWQNIVNQKYSITEVPADRWSLTNYYDPDPTAPDKTYTKIGAYVQGYHVDAFKLGLPIPPKVMQTMDYAQQWAIAATSQALSDYGYPNKLLDPERVAVIFGNSNAGERHYTSTLRIHAPEYLDVLKAIPNFQALPAETQHTILDGMLSGIRARIPEITEDTMPGELSNIIAGRVANVFNFCGPNFVTDAACASSLAAIQAAVDGLENRQFDAVITGGIDRSMGPESYVKFCKIGALSVDGSRPYAEGANGFVMGEGAIVYLLKRLEDAESAGDKVYAVIRGIGGSSDGKGKGITAPNPLGQQRAIDRAWKDAGLSPDTVGLIEGHGTSTKVGDVTEVNSLNAVFGQYNMKHGSVALGSVKSNIGHLKSAAGAAGVLKTSLALYHKVLPPNANFDRPNPNIDFGSMPFFVNRQTQAWEVNPGGVRRAGVSSFGFGGTNFHVVMEEYRQGMIDQKSATFAIPQFASITNIHTVASEHPVSNIASTPSDSVSISVNVDIAEITQFVLRTVSEKTGYPPEMLDLELDLEADLGVDTVKQAELFATIRTHYGIARREDLRLTDYNTLTKVIGFMVDALSNGTGTVSATISPSATAINNRSQSSHAVVTSAANETTPSPYQGLFFVSADTRQGLKTELAAIIERVKGGNIPPSVCPTVEQVGKNERIAIDYVDSAELIKRCEKALSALETDTQNTWQALQGQGIYRGSGQAGKVVFMFPGQGSQYVNMLKDLYDTEPVVKETFDEADRVMTPILGRPLTSYIYVDGDEESIKVAEKDLKNTAITQPAMLTTNVALLRVMEKYGFTPDMVIGHSLGEYAALVAADVLSFPEALEVVSARGQEMTKLKMEDNGCMAAVSAPLEKVESIVNSVNGYVVIANINSPLQSVIGGETVAVDEAIAKFTLEGFQAVKIPVSHAFHTNIVAPASEPLMKVISRMNIQPPIRTIIANVTGEVYPNTREEIVNILGAQVASPVQFVKSMQTLFDLGARVFVEVGPKRVLNALASDNQKDKPGVTLLSTNHPRKGGKASFNEALCGLYASGIAGGKPSTEDNKSLFAFTDKVEDMGVEPTSLLSDRSLPSVYGHSLITGSIVVTGVGLGLPGKNGNVFDDKNIESILHGDMRIEPFSKDARKAMIAMKVTRLVKSDAGATLEDITDIDQAIKLAGQRGNFDLNKDFGVPEERVDSLDLSSQLAIGAGVEALRDAGIPLVMHYKSTSRGTFLPDRWKLPESLQDETGVIFCSAFPGLNRMAEETDHYASFRILTGQLDEIQTLIYQFGNFGAPQVVTALEQRAIEIKKEIEQLDYHFDRRFIFRVLSMGHSQFAEYIGARGPNTHVNAACATTTHAVSIAEDWIRAGRCRRVIIIAGDDVTNPNLVQWIGSSMFASGAATTEGDLHLAAVPFDRRRNGMIMGMGAAALVVESEDAARERGVRGICEVLSTITANSAYHGTRLDVKHVSEIMDKLLRVAESRFGITRSEIAQKTAFISHETYTPARGGSASAEIHALRNNFGSEANRIIIANTKGFTGHSMGVGIEDVVAVKILETGIVPPIAFIKDGFEPDPELGDLNLSVGGVYDPQYTIRLGAGFGSQIAMTLCRKVEGVGQRVDRKTHDLWMSSASGYPTVETELIQRTLRIKDQGQPVMKPSSTRWEYGQGPTLWAGKPADNRQMQVNVVEKVLNVSQPVTISPATPMEISGSSQDIQAYVLSAVSEKTGYPPEMLDLELDLEADLGIDTVKQAELFAAIRSHFGIPRREDLRLSEYNTLSKVISFVKDNLVNQEGEKIETQTVKTAAFEPEPAPSIPQGLKPDESIKDFVQAIISEKTGYPVEMLDLELDLEADLGIDTVKQAELFAAVRTHYDIPRREDLRLADYNTIQKVIGFVVENLNKSAPATPKIVDQSQPVEHAESNQENDSKVVIKRRVPRPVLQPKLDLCLPTGVVINAESRILIVRDSSNIAELLAKKIGKKGAKVVIVPALEAVSTAANWVENEKIQGIYYLTGLDEDPAWDGMELNDWKKAICIRSETLFELAKVIPEDAFLITPTRMGGLLGLLNTINPMGGAVSGFSKALARERVNGLIKTIDFDQHAPANSIVSKLIDETLADPSNTEVGYEGEIRYAVTIIDQPTGNQQKPLVKDSVFIITGGTAGVIPPVVKDLARATEGKFFLLGRTKLTSKDDPRLKKLKEDRESLKQEISKTLATCGGNVTPMLIEHELETLEKIQKTLDLIDYVQSVGGEAVYMECDINNFSSVNDVIFKVIKDTSRVDVLIHAAGYEKSRKIASKKNEEFHQVFDVKADGLFNLLRALENAKSIPARCVLFSSVAGRFGNPGQVDYSAANDLLNKYSSWLPVQYPGMQALAIDWGAWAEIGMASRGSIPMLMQRAGIDMMDPIAAAMFVRTELEAGTCGEILISGSLGELESVSKDQNKIDNNRADASLRGGAPEYKMTTQVAGFDANGVLSLETDLDPAEHPFLRDHAINGTPVLPGVMGIEGFSLAARHIASTLAGNKTGFLVDHLEDIQFLAPFKFYKNLPRRIQWKARAIREENRLVVYATLESDIKRSHGQQEHSLHFSGKLFLSQKLSQPNVISDLPVWNGGETVCAKDIYDLYFHGPTFQVLECAQRSGDVILGKFSNKLHQDTQEPTEVNIPLLVELCFQTAGLWEVGATGIMALPHSIGQLTIYPRKVNGEPIYAEVLPINEDGMISFNARVVDGKGRLYLELCNYQTSPLPYAVEPQKMEPMKVLVKK